jgi:hypothetical protein
MTIHFFRLGLHSVFAGPSHLSPAAQWAKTIVEYLEGDIEKVLPCVCDAVD